MNNKTQVSVTLLAVIITFGVTYLFMSNTNDELQNTDTEIGNIDSQIEKVEENDEFDYNLLTYSDEDISFSYPETFLGTSWEEEYDQVYENTEDPSLTRNTWSVERNGNVISIVPNFQSPMAEGGSVYEIVILNDRWEAEEEWNRPASNNPGPETTWGTEIEDAKAGYYVGVLENVDFGFGRIVDTYTMIPGGIDGRAQSLEPTEKHAIIYAEDGSYENYVTDILLPSIELK